MIDDVLERTDIAAGICSAATRGGFDQVLDQAGWHSWFYYTPKQSAPSQITSS
jgi:hypothetical protein